MERVTAPLLEGALAKAARGDAAAFREIVREHQSMVFSLAYHFFRDRGLAEDLAQEVFLQLHQNLASIRSPAHLTYWLRRVTYHRCIDMARRERGQAALSLEEVPEPFSAPSEADPLLAGKLRQLVAALPEKRRMVVVLRYQEDLELHEIAEIMEMPINSVKSTLQRSVAVLRAKLARVTGDVRV